MEWGSPLASGPTYTLFLIATITCGDLNCYFYFLCFRKRFTQRRFRSFSNRGSNEYSNHRSYVRPVLLSSSRLVKDDLLVMELFRWRGVNGLPDKLGCFSIKIKKIALQNNLSFCWMGKLSGKPVTPLYLKRFMCWCTSQLIIKLKQVILSFTNQRLCFSFRY